MQIKTTNPAGTLTLSANPRKLVVAVAGGVGLIRAIATVGTVSFEPEGKAVDTVPLRMKALETPEVMAACRRHFGLDAASEPQPVAAKFAAPPLSATPQPTATRIQDRLEPSEKT